MSKRSDYILGQSIFIKVISLTHDDGVRLSRALISQNELPPFSTNEFLINHLISRENVPILNGNKIIPPRYNSLLSPKTVVLVSSKSYNIEYFNKYINSSYKNTMNDLMRSFSLMDNYLNLSSRGKTIRTALIISEAVTGSYNDFLKKNSEDENYDKMVIDSLIHISYLYQKFQENYQCVHGDPKIHNYTWLELKTPINIEYDFRDEYNSGNRLIRRSNVKHLFYLTDLEFAYSPIIKIININDNNYYYNFKNQVGIYGRDNNNKENNEIIYVPKITKDSPYRYNTNLYGGYNYEPNKIFEGDNNTLFDLFEPIFPRMFTIDILTLVKMMLTYSYADSFNGDVLRKLNIYFTQFVSLSLMEENPNRRGKGNYLRVSPGTFGELLNSN